MWRRILKWCCSHVYVFINICKNILITGLQDFLKFYITTKYNWFISKIYFVSVPEPPKLETAAASTTQLTTLVWRSFDRSFLITSTTKKTSASPTDPWSPSTSTSTTSTTTTKAKQTKSKTFRKVKIKLLRKRVKM
jgi:hypothetical protein